MTGDSLVNLSWQAPSTDGGVTIDESKDGELKISVAIVVSLGVNIPDIVNGVPFEEIGNRINDYIDLDFGEAKITSQAATGKIIYIDSFGNIITNIKGYQLSSILDYNNKNTVVIGGIKRRLPFVKSYSFVKKGQYLVTINSSNMIEIGINQGIAAKKLGVKSDDEIKILFD